MPTSTQMIWLCGHCGRPVADNPTKWIGGVPFHVECTMSPYAGKVGCPNCNPAKMREEVRLVEREACAVVADDQDECTHLMATKIAELIRARNGK